MRAELSRLYAIVDAAVLAGRGLDVGDTAHQLSAAGAGLVQWRDKGASPQDVLRRAALLLRAFSGTKCRLVMNDRADLALLGDFVGVHVGQEDLLPEDARRVIGSERWVGVSTHNEAQVRAAELSCADYVAIGPVFTTGTKLNAEPVVGLDGVRRARALTSKPLVAIGGVTRENARSVMDAGANSVAVISGLFVPGETVEKVARDFLEILG